MKVKVLLLSLMLSLSVVLLTACEEGTMVYQGEERPVSEVEEIIADQLEVENPDLDLEVSIFEESED